MPDDPRDPDHRDEEASPEPAKEEAAGEAADNLTDYWDDILGPRPEQIRDRLVRELGIPHPGTLTLATNSGRVIVQIDPNGKVRLGEGITADEAAEEFWTMMALKRKGMEERLTQLSIMESMLLRIARADVSYERAQMARKVSGQEEPSFDEELRRRNLEALVHQMIEFSRGLLARPDVEAPPSEPDLH